PAVVPCWVVPAAVVPWSFLPPQPKRLRASTAASAAARARFLFLNILMSSCLCLSFHKLTKEKGGPQASQGDVFLTKPLHLFADLLLAGAHGQNGFFHKLLQAPAQALGSLADHIP